jgi:serine/threonine protein kinase
MSIETAAQIVDLLREHGLLSASPAEVNDLVKQAPDGPGLLREMVQRGWLTKYQAEQVRAGKVRDLAPGAYRLLEPLGAGGMACVYLARHVPMDRRVALKILHPEAVANPRSVERFQREMRAAAQLSHPHIVTAYDAGKVGDVCFLAMEYIEGSDLARLVRDEGTLSVDRACEYIKQAALGLQYAHEQGLVHRDIKPSNLLLTKPDRRGRCSVKVLDFGLACFASAANSRGRLTQAGKLMGTVDYISPEQAEDASKADIRADIYSLGCTLFFLLTGRPPFDGTDVVERLSARVLGDAPRVRSLRMDVPRKLDDVLAKMLARDPGERYQTPADVVEAIEPFTDPGETRTADRSRSVSPATEPLTTAPPDTSEEEKPVRPKKQRSSVRDIPSPSSDARPWQAWHGVLIGAGAVLLLAAIVLPFALRKKAQPSPTPPGSEEVVARLPDKQQDPKPVDKSTENPPDPPKDRSTVKPPDPPKDGATVKPPDKGPGNETPPPKTWPEPQLEFVKHEKVPQGTRYDFTIRNWADLPAEVFSFLQGASPRDTVLLAARAWLELRTSEGQRLSLVGVVRNNTTFSYVVPANEDAPGKVVAVLIDRDQKKKTEFQSAVLDLPEAILAKAVRPDPTKPPPAPKLIFVEANLLPNSPNKSKEYIFAVENWAEFPEELFAPGGPGLMPINIVSGKPLTLPDNAPRTIPLLYREDGALLKGFGTPGAYTKPSSLQKIALLGGTDGPASIEGKKVRLILQDRKDGKKYESNLVPVPKQ